MNYLQKTKSFFSSSLVKHVLFWLGIYAYFIGTVYTGKDGGSKELIKHVEHYSIYVFCQVVIAYTSLYVLIPRFLTPKKHIQFVIYLLVLIVGLFILFVGFHEYYFIPKHLDTSEITSHNASEMFWERLLNLRIFLGKSTTILTPAIFLVIVKFYKDQQHYLQVNEQKKSNELAALKHQLNPHFLFNTLNNLYALSIEKSDEAPEVIAKLSEILDYILYGCNDQYVALQKEIELIDNYLALEKLRYGKRVDIEFQQNIESSVKIAPLILLTFIENAFKHGVSQELKVAFIKIVVTQKEQFIHCNIVNSIAKNKVSSNKKSIGISNVTKQLELLYLDSYSLEIKEKKDRFEIHLKLPVKK